MITTVSKPLCVFVGLVLLAQIAATHDPGAPTQGQHPSHDVHPSMSLPFLPHWANPSRIYQAILSRNASTRCSSRGGFQGVCEPTEKCTSHADTFRSSKVCLREGQVCCSATSSPKPIATCNQMVYRSGVHFVNTLDMKENCLVVVRTPPSVCQVRLDFLAFKISQPTTDMEDKTRCVDDVFSVHAGSGSVAYPSICGDNDYQHLLIDVKGSDTVVLNMKLATYLNVTRYWNIKVSFETCNSPNLAPAGCLQRYTAGNGAVRPFNFGPSNELIEGLKYQVCLIPRASTCRIFMNNRLHNIRGPVFLNFVSQDISSVSIGPLYTLRNETGQKIHPVGQCRTRLGKSMQAHQSPVRRAPMKYSMVESSPKLIEWLVSGNVKSLDLDFVKHVGRIPQEENDVANGGALPIASADAEMYARDFDPEGNPAEEGSALSENELMRIAIGSVPGAGRPGERNTTRGDEDQEEPEMRKLAQFVLELPIDGVTQSLRRTLGDDYRVDELLRTHDHPEHNITHEHPGHNITHEHPEHNITHEHHEAVIVPEHPDRQWIQQLQEQHRQAALDRLNALAQNHSSSDHHVHPDHHSSSPHHASSEHQGILCHSGSHAHDQEHPHHQHCESNSEGASTTPAPVASTTVPPAEVFVSPEEHPQLVIDASDDEKEEDDGPDPSAPRLTVQLNRPERNSSSAEPVCDGFKLTANITQKCLTDAHPEKCYFDAIHSHSSGIHDNISKCNYTAAQLVAHQHEFEKQALQQYLKLQSVIHSHPPHPANGSHSGAHVQPTHSAQTGAQVHPTHSPHTGVHVHPTHEPHSGHQSHHPHHPSGSTGPNVSGASMNGKGNQLVVPVVIYVPIKSTIYNQFNQRKIYQVNANLTKLLEESLMNSSSSEFLMEIGNPRAPGEEEPLVMEFSKQFELLYNFEQC